MVAAVDPTYPLYPIACILSAVMLLLVLITSFIRQSWNLGVAFLCFWLFWENITFGINAIIWSDNSDIKLYIYCDIVTHMQVITSVVKPMATFIITRRLYLIASLRSVELPDKAVKHRNLAIEWTLGLALPVIVAGPFYYIVQEFRFEVLAGFGCQSTADDSSLGILLINSWAVVPPLLSIAVYYPRVLRIFYQQKRAMDHFLQSNNSVSRLSFFPIFALASIDLILTLPVGIVTIVLEVVESLVQTGNFPLYTGWNVLHSNMEPLGLSYTKLVAAGTSTLAQLYFVHWTSPVLAFAIFSLFGITAEARASYWRIICTVEGWFGWKPPIRMRKARSPTGTTEFGARPQDTSLNLDIESQPSYVDPNARAEQGIEGRGVRGLTHELEGDSYPEIAEEPYMEYNYTANTGAHPNQHRGDYDPDGEKPVDASNAV
ncbi:STE3-domain-containing protein [Peniophora sp. CONT]|nr:STE3-domain-containing protein [Peniophora sp. CONT]